MRGEELAVAQRVVRRLAEQVRLEAERKTTPHRAPGQVAGRLQLTQPRPRTAALRPHETARPDSIGITTHQR